MDLKLSNYSQAVVQTPNNPFTLALIREELKSRKLFHALHQVGIDDCYFQPHLDELILNSLGIEEHTDELFGRYDDILERHSRRISADRKSVRRHAVKVYEELVEMIGKQASLEVAA